MSYDARLREKANQLLDNHFSLLKYNKQITLCRQTIDIHFSDEILANKYYPALQHLETNNAESAASFSLFVIDIGLLAERKYSSLAAFLAIFFQNESNHTDQISSGSHYLAFDDFAYYFNHETHWGIWFINQSKDFSQWHFANPFRYFFYNWLLYKNYQLIHAAAITDGNTVVLLSGPSGAGKSTTAIMCLQAGYQLLGDDHCAVSLETNPRVFSLYNTVKLDKKLLVKELHAFKAYANEFIHTEQMHKAIINVPRNNKDAMQNNLPLSAVVNIHINASLTNPIIKNMDKLTALKKLSLSTIEQCPLISRRKVFANIKDIIESTSCYDLTLCSNHQKNLTKISDLFYARRIHHHSLL